MPDLIGRYQQTACVAVKGRRFEIAVMAHRPVSLMSLLGDGPISNGATTYVCHAWPEGRLRVGQSFAWASCDDEAEAIRRCKEKIHKRLEREGAPDA